MHTINSKVFAKFTAEQKTAYVDVQEALVNVEDLGKALWAKLDKDQKKATLDWMDNLFGQVLSNIEKYD